MVNIIGAGPIGCYTGFLLAKKGYKVNIYEEHDSIGKPEHCTGIVTSDFAQLIEPKKDFVVNHTTYVELHAPNGENITLRSEEFILDRPAFDQYLSHKAENSGCRIFLNKRFPAPDINIGQTLIAADGPNSAVARHFGFFKQRHFLTGYQADVSGSFDKTRYHIFLGTELGSFGWLVPVNEEVARLGIMCNDGQVRHHFENVLHKVEYTKMLKTYGGLIPLFDPNLPAVRNNVFLVGDAAGFVKATTGGGLVPGMKSAKCLAEAITQNKNYNPLWKASIGRELKLALLLRRVLDRFTDDDFNYLLSLISKQAVKNVLETVTRENPSKMLLKLLLREPRFLYYIKHLI